MEACDFPPNKSIYTLSHRLQPREARFIAKQTDLEYSLSMWFGGCRSTRCCAEA